MRYAQYITPKITEKNGCYELTTGYDAGFVTDLKTMIPASHRRYDPSLKKWIVSSQYGGVASELIEKYFATKITLPSSTVIDTEQTGIFKVLYIGTCKTRSDGESTAFGWVDGAWNLIIPETALRDWFHDGPEIPRGSYYTILGVRQDATEEEIRAGFRRMAKQWHPDLNHEYNSTAVFRKIQEAYDILRDPRSKARYDAGLMLEATIKKEKLNINSFNENFEKYGYRAPLLNGLIMARYQEVLDRKFIKKILHWADITNEFGQTLVSSWVIGEETPRLEWI